MMNSLKLKRLNVLENRVLVLDTWILKIHVKVKLYFFLKNTEHNTLVDVVDCGCHPIGSGGNTTCADFTGQCGCASFYTGRDCSDCASYAYREEGEFECKPCGCNTFNTVGNSSSCTLGQCDCASGFCGKHCDGHLINGTCTCPAGYEGDNCDTCAYAYYSIGNSCNCKSFHSEHLGLYF